MRRILLALTLLAAAGCADSLSPRDELNAARSRWAEWEPASYDLVVTQSCFCPGPYQVRTEVRNGIVTGQFDVATGNPLPAPSDDFTAGGLFAVIEREAGKTLDRFEVVYDGLTGLPRSIAVDHRFSVADDEFFYSAVLTAK